jgi:hypothetical protein
MDISPATIPIRSADYRTGYGKNQSKLARNPRLA